MEFITKLFQWFSGGENPYHTLRACMRGDTFWILATVTLDFLVAAGYVLIAYHWWQNQKKIASGPAKRALSQMRNIFVFCGICGYLFIPIKMIWPAWRLYDIFLAFLVYFTWRYALGTRELKVIYSELGKTRQLTDDLRKSREESRKKGMFLNAVSHDLRSPLNALTLQAGLLDIELGAGNLNTLHKVARDISVNARAAADLLDHLLEYARMNADPAQNHLSQVNLSELIGKCSTAFHVSAAAKDLPIRVDCPEELRVETDAMKLDRILRNLINNAVKFTCKGSVRIMAVRTENQVEVHVIDTGVGIDPEHQEHLFDDFYQVDNAERDRKRGFGLGLSIARQLARQLGGDISCRSTLGKGSSFCLELPAGSVREVAPAPAEEPARTDAVLAVQGQGADR